jgi:predicted DNA-binding transcriptional regulator YafY
MRADRLLSIVLLLQANHMMTAAQLAASLEVSERTIYRDMEALSMAGIPVVAERGKGGGWSLLEGYRTSLTGLHPHEIDALFVTRSSEKLADLGMEDGQSWLKLLAALPHMQQRQAHDVRQRIYIDTENWKQTRDPMPFLPTVQEAVWQNQRLSVQYQRGDGSVRERIINPLGLVAKGSQWYLVAQTDGDIRTYRISRILGAKTLPETFERPSDFDLATYWQQSTREFVRTLPEYRLKVETHHDNIPFLKMAGWYSRVEGISEPDERGCIVATVISETEIEALAYVLSLGARVKLLEPVELRQKLRQELSAVQQIYEEG